MSGLSQDVKEGKEVIRYSIENGDYMEVTPETGEFSFHTASGSGKVSEESQRQIMSGLAEIADEVSIQETFGSCPGIVYSEDRCPVIDAKKTGIGTGFSRLSKFNLHRDEVPLDAPENPCYEVTKAIASVCYI